MFRTKQNSFRTSILFELIRSEISFHKLDFKNRCKQLVWCVGDAIG